jgi:hypothetical protein
VKRPPNTKHRDERKRRRKARAPEAPAVPTYRHPMFGPIPLIPHFAADGRFRGFEFDPDYAPPLPKGAVRGDPRRQDIYSGFQVPRYFFVDIHLVCIECREPFVFGAREQKYWYETLKFHPDSVATRCLDCRRKRRSDRALRQELAVAKVAARNRVDDPSTLLSLAEAIVRYFERFQEGNLEEAVAASRKARRLFRGHLSKQARRAVFWEGMSQAFAGKRAQARALLAEFLAAGSVGRGYTALYREAKRWLAADARAAKV